MEAVYTQLTLAVAAALTNAPDSPAKMELIEELTENLHQRYLDMVAEGAEPQQAYARTLEELGDTEQLVDYLKQLPADQPLPWPEQGEVPPSQTRLQLEAIAKNLEEMARGALEQARQALERTNVEEKVSSATAHVWQALEQMRQAVHRATADQEGGEGPGADSTPEGASGQPAADAPCQEDGQEDGAEDAPEHAPLTYPSGEAAEGVMHALHTLRVSIPGNLTLRMNQPEDGDVVVGGDNSKLCVSRSKDGVLTIRSADTAVTSFLFRRGVALGDVELSLPCRPWRKLDLQVQGDIHLEGDVPVEQLALSCTRGDAWAKLPHCDTLAAAARHGDLSLEMDVGKAALSVQGGDMKLRGRLDTVKASVEAGDLRLESLAPAQNLVLSARAGNLWVAMPHCQTLTAETHCSSLHVEGEVAKANLEAVMGDVKAKGCFANLSGTAVNGDFQLSGYVGKGAFQSTNGDVCLELTALPDSLEVGSDAGDCTVKLPLEQGAFQMALSAPSGTLELEEFPFTGSHMGIYTYAPDGHSAEGRLPCYKVRTQSGTVTVSAT